MLEEERRLCEEKMHVRELVAEVEQLETNRKSLFRQVPLRLS